MIQPDVGARTLAGAVLCLVLGGCAAPAPAPPADTETVHRIGNLVVRNVPDIPPAVFERLQQYQNTRAARLQGWLGDGVLVSTRFGDTQQLHRVDQPGAARRQLTFFNEPVAAAMTAPPGDEDGFLYLSDRGGSEFFQLYWFDLAAAIRGCSATDAPATPRWCGPMPATASPTPPPSATAGPGTFTFRISTAPSRGPRTRRRRLDGAGLRARRQRLLLTRYVSINESYLYECRSTAAC
jgi:hypothetical protein